MTPEMKQTLDTIGTVGFSPRNLSMFLGAKDCLYSDKDLSFSFKFSNKVVSKPNYCEIRYNRGQDLFEMSLKRITNLQVKVLQEETGLYTDQLKPIFEKSTGLYLSFR
jgi:hypothetical protein